MNGQVPSIITAVDQTQYFTSCVREIHGNKYSYDKINYINKKNKVIITCLEHGDFEQLPSNILTTNGCLKCANEDKSGGWYKNPLNYDKAAIMYILQISGNGESFMKYGVTTNISKRISSIKGGSAENYKVEIIKKISGTVKYCYALEQRFKKLIKKNTMKYSIYIPKIHFCGKYECFKII